MVEGFVSDMVTKSSYLEAPTIVKDSNETTDGNEMGNFKSIVVDENDNNSVKRANTILKPNNNLGARVLEKRKNVFTNELTTMMCGITTSTHL